MKQSALKICVVSVDFLPKLGGVSMMAHHLANALAQQGAEVMVIGPKDSAVPRGLTANYLLTADQGSRPQWRDRWNGIREDGRIKIFLATLYERFQFGRALLLHPFYYGPALVNFCKAMGIDVWVVFHGTELRSQLMPRARLRGLGAKMLGKGPSLLERTRLVAEQSSEVLTNSTYTAGLVKRLKIDTPIHPIGCGLDIGDYEREIKKIPLYDPAIKRRLRKQSGLPEDKTVVGTMCRLVRSKNVEMLIRAVARMPNTVGAIIGSGPEQPHLEALARQLDCDRRIHWFENVAERRKWKLLATMDVFCLLSNLGKYGEVEGFGIVLLEASAAGTPVIAASSGGMTDVVRNGENGLIVDPRSERQLADAVARILADPETAARQVDCARQRIQHTYNWSSIAGKLLDAWQDTGPASHAVPRPALRATTGPFNRKVANRGS